MAKNSSCCKWIYGLSGNDYTDTMLSKLYLTASEIFMPSLKGILRF